MSAPTRDAPLELRALNDQTPECGHQGCLLEERREGEEYTRPATPADVRLWLLDQGAEERQWCETHADYAMRHLGTSCRWAIKVLANRPRKACRMVSVLIWREAK